MCGRFTQMMTWREIHELYSIAKPVAVPDLQARYNGAPTQDFSVCHVDENGNRTITKFRWGLVPRWARDIGIGARMINARSETVHEKPAFRASFRSKRCLIPADGWFEWQRVGHGKQPYFLALANGSPLSFAGLWERWDRGAEALESFSIITTAADAPLLNVHHRQPAIINPEHFSVWLDDGASADTLLDLARNPRAGPYEIRPVSTRVNNVRNDDQDILSPVSKQA